MHTTIFAATSKDGYIARPDGSEDFLPDSHWDRFEALAREYGNFIVGHTTYERVRDWDEDVNFDALADLVRVVVTRDPSYTAPGFLIATSPQDALEQLAAAGQTKALVVGGAMLNTSFLKEGLVNEIILSIEPVTVGDGIPAWYESRGPKHMHCTDIERTPDGVVVRRCTL